MECTRSFLQEQADTRFPICKLGNLRLASWLPVGCPMRQRDVAGALAMIQDEAHAKLRMRNTSGLSDLARYQTCYSCWSRLGEDPHVKALREAEQAKEQARNTPPPMPPLPDDSPLRLWRARMGFDAPQLAAEFALPVDGPAIHQLSWAIIQVEAGKIPVTDADLLPLWEKTGQELMQEQAEWIRTRPVTRWHTPKIELPGRQAPRATPAASPRSVEDIVHDLTTKRRSTRSHHAG